MKKYTIGIDFGTLSGRCLLTDVETGEETATSVLEYRHRVMSETLPDGTRLGVDWHLQHPGDYLDVLRITIRDVIKQAGIRPEQVIGIGIDTTGCTILPIKNGGNATLLSGKMERQSQCLCEAVETSCCTTLCR